MKKLKTAVLSLALFAGMAQAEWAHVYTNSRGDQFFIDDESMTTNTDDEKIVQAWVLTNFKKTQSAGNLRYNSMVTYYEYNCHMPYEYRYMEGTTYSQRNQKGRVVYQDSSPDDAWEKPVPNTTAYELSKWVCED